MVILRGGTVSLPHNVSYYQYNAQFYAATAEVYSGVTGTVTIEVYLDGKIFDAATASGKDKASVAGPVTKNFKTMPTTTATMSMPTTIKTMTSPTITIRTIPTSSTPASSTPAVEFTVPAAPTLAKP